MLALKARTPRWLRCRIANVEERVTRRAADGTWQFSSYSSGPFGDGSCGEWQNPAETLALQQLIERGSDGMDWFDVHAALE